MSGDHVTQSQRVIIMFGQDVEEEKEEEELSPTLAELGLGQYSGGSGAGVCPRITLVGVLVIYILMVHQPNLNYCCVVIWARLFPVPGTAPRVDRKGRGRAALISLNSYLHSPAREWSWWTEEKLNLKNSSTRKQAKNQHGRRTRATA